MESALHHLSPCIALPHEYHVLFWRGPSIQWPGYKERPSFNRRYHIHDLFDSWIIIFVCLPKLVDIHFLDLFYQSGTVVRKNHVEVLASRYRVRNNVAFVRHPNLHFQLLNESLQFGISPDLAVWDDCPVGAVPRRGRWL